MRQFIKLVVRLDINLVILCDVVPVIMCFVKFSPQAKGSFQ